MELTVAIPGFGKLRSPVFEFSSVEECSYQIVYQSVCSETEAIYKYIDTMTIS